MRAVYSFSVAMLMALVAGSPLAAAEPLQAGVAVVDITPPVPYRMSGYFSERVSTGTHDPLLAKALVLRQGDRQAAIVFCDLIGIAPDVSADARQKAAAKTGIPAEHIVVHGTHSHTGPLYWGALRDHFHQRASERAGSDPYETVDYPTQLADRIVAAITDAQRALVPVTLAAGEADQRGLSFNRRFHMKDGTVRFNPGKLNPDIVRPCGPIDPEVGLVLLRPADRPKAPPLALVSSFALHLDTVGGTEYGADYPLYVQQTLSEKFGKDFVSLFGTGTCGDINHIDVSHKRPQKGQVEAERIGRTLGETILAAVDKLPVVKEPSLAAGSATAQVPLQEFSPEQIAKARRDLNQVGTRELGFLEQVTAYKIAAVAGRKSETIDLEVQAIRLSDEVAMVFLPGEVFVELGLEIKRASPFKTTLVVELCNDAPGYIPTRKAFAEGSYETVNSRVQPGGGEAMLQTAIKLLKQLK